MEKYLTEGEIAEQLQVSRTLLWSLRREGFPHCRIGRVVRYRAEDVENWLKQHTVTGGNAELVIKGGQK